MPNTLIAKDPGGQITVDGRRYTKGSAARNSGIVSYWLGGRQLGHVDHITLESDRDHVFNQYDFHFHIDGTRYNVFLKGEDAPRISHNDKFQRNWTVPQSVIAFATQVISQVTEYEPVITDDEFFAAFMAEDAFSDDSYSDDDYDDFGYDEDSFVTERQRKVASRSTQF